MQDHAPAGVLTASVLEVGGNDAGRPEEEIVKLIFLRDQGTTCCSSVTPLMCGLALTCDRYEDMCPRNSPEMIPDGPRGLSSPLYWPESVDSPAKMKVSRFAGVATLGVT